MAFDPLPPGDIMEPDPLLRAAAVALYQAHPEGIYGKNPAATLLWRKHQSISLLSDTNLAWDKVVTALEAQRVVPLDSPHESRRKYEPVFKLPPEEKIMLRHMLTRSPSGGILTMLLEETVLLRHYQDILKTQPNDLSPTHVAQVKAVEENLAARVESIMELVNHPTPKLGRDNVVAFRPADRSPQ